jgi:hypothetical protein
MARRRRSGKSGAGRTQLRRRPLAARREDRLSGLSDDILLLILRRLHTRSALATGLLSKRWAHLPRELDALDLRVGDMLPPRYHRWVDLHKDLYTNLMTAYYYRPRAASLVLVPNIRRYERRAMRAFTCYAASLSEGPRRRVKRLSLEFFITGNAGGMNRLVADAIDAWGVEDLEVVAKPIFRTRGQGELDTFPKHTFPSHGLCKEPRASRLRSLRLGGCAPPPLHEYNALTTLVLQGLQDSTPVAFYEGIFTLCPQLRTLHLISCGCRSAARPHLPLVVAVDAPDSQIRELVVKDCTFRKLLMRALPRLESLALLDGRMWFEESSSFPCLRQRNLTMDRGMKGLDPNAMELDTFLECTPEIRSFIIRFTGPYIWVLPPSSPSEILPNLKRLLVADVPWSWDVTWPLLILEMAPSLETLHIHIAPADSGRKDEPAGEEIPWSPTELRQQHHHLKEFVVAGFKGTARQIYLVRYVMGVCRELCRLSMFKNGRVQYRGHWDWEIVPQDQEQSWSDEEKRSMLEQIVDSVSSTAPVQLVLG